MSDWYKEKIDHVLQHVKTDVATGLWEAEAILRLSQHGSNELVEQGARKPRVIVGG